MNSEELLVVLDALGHTQRLRILAMLATERVHVSELARRLELSRPLVIMHLKRLEKAGLIVGSTELSADSKAMKFYVPAEFDIHLTPATVLAAIGADEPAEGPAENDAQEKPAHAQVEPAERNRSK